MTSHLLGRGGPAGWFHSGHCDLSLSCPWCTEGRFLTYFPFPIVVYCANNDEMNVLLIETLNERAVPNIILCSMRKDANETILSENDC